MQPIQPDNPFAVFTFLVAPAILTNASTVLTLGTSNRLARAVDRTRALAGVLLAAPGVTPPPGAASIPRGLAERQFTDASRRCRVLIRALRCFYLAVGCFAAGTCVAMVGAALGHFGFEVAARWTMTAMLVLAGVGVLSLVLGSSYLVTETTLTLSLLRCEQEAINDMLVASGQRPMDVAK